jgi:hypothetical protein
LNSNEPIQIETHVIKNEQQLNSTDIAVLRIRSETGKRTMIVKMLITDKIG